MYPCTCTLPAVTYGRRAGLWCNVPSGTIYIDKNIALQRLATVMRTVISCSEADPRSSVSMVNVCSCAQKECPWRCRNVPVRRVFDVCGNMRLMHSIPSNGHTAEVSPGSNYIFCSGREATVRLESASKMTWFHIQIGPWQLLPGSYLNSVIGRLYPSIPEVRVLLSYPFARHSPTPLVLLHLVRAAASRQMLSGCAHYVHICDCTQMPLSRLSM